MNRKTLALAVGGTITLGGLLGVAAEPDWMNAEDDRPAAKEVAPPVPTGRRILPTAGRTPAESAPRNYYDELFADDEASTPASRKKGPLPASAPKRQLLEPDADVKAGAKSKTTPVSSRAIPDFADEAATPPAKSKFEEKKPFPGKHSALKAELDPGLEKPVKEPIQQTRVETRAKTAHIPLPPNRPRGSSVNVIAPQHHAALLPSHGPHQTSVTVEWVKKADFNVGQECLVELLVKNTGPCAAEHVIVDATFQSPLRLVASRPEATENRDRLCWELDRLSAGEERRIELTVVPSRRGELGFLAEVHFTGSAVSTFRVEEPLLNVAVKGPAEAMLGAAVSQTVVISNPGTGAANDVRVTTEVSSGLELARGETESGTMEIGTIAPGESRTVRLPMTALRGGPQTINVTVSSSADVTSDASTTINVVSPSLKLHADGPALRYKGRNAKFTAQVTNDGSVANNNVRVTQTVADGFQFVSADHGGKYDPEQKTVSWFLGRLEAEQSMHVACELMAVELGDFTQKFQVASDAGANAESAVETKVDGASKLTMEVVDVDDPVEVGTETAYEIRIKNSGSKAATHVAVSCELPAGVQYLSSKGPSEAAHQKHSLVFKTLPHLAPGQDAVYRVHVKGTQDGNHRLKARVSSDSLPEPLLQEEATKFYSDARR